MPFPEAARVELPILQELSAAGGSDQPRYLYGRLIRYFPQLTPEDLEEKTVSRRSRWHLLVQRAGSQLVEKGELRREGSRWALTARGGKRVEDEAMTVVAPTNAEGDAARAVSHKEAQRMLVEIGEMLGRYAEAEFDYYDVVWRESRFAPRLSHVFEVQVAGSVDSALTRLKHAFDAQRSRIFLVIADDKATAFAEKRLTGAFHEILEQVTIIGVGELKRLHDSLKAHRQLLGKILEPN